MTPAFTVILPHRRNKGNDRALQVCLSCLFDNTVSDFKLIIDAAEDQPLYPRINALVEQSTTDCVVYLASDVFVSKAWDVPMLALWDANTIVNNIIVEPRAIAMSAQNLERDFGRTPEQFAAHRGEFEAWVSDAHFPAGEGWFSGYMFSRSAFLERGGFATDEAPDAMGFSGADALFFDQWKQSGKQVVRARSYAYHLQRWSDIGEQEADKRK